jgi:hypothetical protein
MPAIAIPVVVALLYLLVPGVSERPWTPLRITGGMITVISYVLLVIAGKQLGESLSVRAEEGKLVAHGLHSRVRNPIYILAELMPAGGHPGYAPVLSVRYCPGVDYHPGRGRKGGCAGHALGDDGHNVWMRTPPA